MTHRDEAVRILEEADRDVSENWLYNTGEHKADIIAQAQVHTLLEIGEQLRVANLIALWRGSAVKNEYASEGEHGLFDTRGKLRPHIAEVLRLDGDPQ